MVQSQKVSKSILKHFPPQLLTPNQCFLFGTPSLIDVLYFLPENFKHA